MFIDEESYNLQTMLYLQLPKVYLKRFKSGQVSCFIHEPSSTGSSVCTTGDACASIAFSALVYAKLPTHSRIWT